MTTLRSTSCVIAILLCCCGHERAADPDLDTLCQESFASLAGRIGGTLAPDLLVVSPSTSLCTDARDATLRRLRWDLPSLRVDTFLDWQKQNATPCDLTFTNAPPWRLCYATAEDKEAFESWGELHDDYE